MIGEETCCPTHLKQSDKTVFQAQVEQTGMCGREGGQAIKSKLSELFGNAGKPRKLHWLSRVEHGVLIRGDRKDDTI